MPKKFTYYETPKDPFREALAAVVGKEPPEYVRGFGLREMTGKQVSDLQDWCSVNARPEWATGLSMIEAAELIVEGAVENANIECQCAGTGEMVDERLEDEAEGNTRHRTCEVCRPRG